MKLRFWKKLPWYIIPRMNCGKKHTMLWWRFFHSSQLKKTRVQFVLGIRIKYLMSYLPKLSFKNLNFYFNLYYNAIFFCDHRIVNLSLLFIWTSTCFLPTNLLFANMPLNTFMRLLKMCTAKPSTKFCVGKP
jgi:hypothetical protein